MIDIRSRRYFVSEKPRLWHDMPCGVDSQSTLSGLSSTPANHGVDPLQARDCVCSCRPAAICTKHYVRFCFVGLALAWREPAHVPVLMLINPHEITVDRRPGPAVVPSGRQRPVLRTADGVAGAAEDAAGREQVATGSAPGAAAALRHQAAEGLAGRWVASDGHFAPFPLHLSLCTCTLNYVACNTNDGTAIGLCAFC